ncbi:ketosynthase chain-length factor [Rhodococcus sp. H29-C3]|uniref:ketosynthase chain-length factor n=1 Tax=Rhodococcus sp. H29-C3 TaxID=3046307 RepID=UPI0024BB2F1B|nr:ketosynthase chain-length factor [Rhodococcus sp. H29-C3]MDJ0362466.1 ketosynthase chain-length factor [Rhodococcus sp. H29-C3]
MVKTVISGIGVLAPTGVGTKEYWDATRVGKSGLGPISSIDATQYPVNVAGEIRDFTPEALLPSRLKPQTDRVTRLSLVASDWAVADAQLNLAELDRFSVGVSTASTAGGFGFAERELRNLWRNGSQHVSAYQSFAWFYAVNTGQISIRHGLKGPSGVLVSDAAGGIDALAQARRQIRKGTDVMLSGAIDSTLCAWGLVGQYSSGRLSEAADPDSAYLPFDHRATGHVPGEGGALFVLESEQNAVSRGAEIYGVLAGYGSSFDHSGSARSDGLIHAIQTALADAHVAASDVDVVFADAAGVVELDRAEADAIGSVFGRNKIAVTAPKTATGRLYSGGGPLDIATALLSMSNNVIPPTINVEVDEAYEMDLVCHPRDVQINTALVISRGYRGFNSAAILTKIDTTHH